MIRLILSLLGFGYHCPAVPTSAVILGRFACSGTCTAEPKKAQAIINFFLGTLRFGDSLAVARIARWEGSVTSDAGWWRVLFTLGLALSLVASAVIRMALVGFFGLSPDNSCAQGVFRFTFCHGAP